MDYTTKGICLSTLYQFHSVLLFTFCRFFRCSFSFFMHAPLVLCIPKNPRISAVFPFFTDRCLFRSKTRTALQLTLFENVSRKCLPVLSVKLSSPPLFRLFSFSTQKEAPHSASFSFSFQLFAGKNTLDLSSRRFCTISRHSPKRWKCTISLSRRNLSGLRSSGSSVRVIRCS